MKYRLLYCTGPLDIDVEQYVQTAVRLLGEVTLSHSDYEAYLIITEDEEMAGKWARSASYPDLPLLWVDPIEKEVYPFLSVTEFIKFLEEGGE